MQSRRGPARPCRKTVARAGCGAQAAPDRPAAAPAAGGSITIPGVIPQLPPPPHSPCAPAAACGPGRAQSRGARGAGGPASSQPVPDTGFTRRPEPPRSRRPKPLPTVPPPQRLLRVAPGRPRPKGKRRHRGRLPAARRVSTPAWIATVARPNRDCFLACPIVSTSWTKSNDSRATFPATDTIL